MVRLFLSVALIFLQITAQAQETNQQTNAVEQYGPRRQISTIVYMGLAGAVLGLSTLSFYGRPQDHLTNIPIGFGAGVIIGTIYMTYQAATKPDEFYRQSEYKPNFIYSKNEISYYSDQYTVKKGPLFNYQWTF